MSGKHCFSIKRQGLVGCVAQVKEHLSSKLQALSSNPSTTKKKKKKKVGGGRMGPKQDENPAGQKLEPMMLSGSTQAGMTRAPAAGSPTPVT
jgi:hypothetical protein